MFKFLLAPADEEIKRFCQRANLPKGRDAKLPV